MTAYTAPTAQSAPTIQSAPTVQSAPPVQIAASLRPGPPQQPGLPVQPGPAEGAVRRGAAEPVGPVGPVGRLGSADPIAEPFADPFASARPGSPELLRSVFRQHAAGVAVITSVDGDRPVGFTATSLNSVSADPPLLSFTTGTGSSTWPALRDCDHLGVHILGEHQRELAGLFARSGADRFGPGTGWSRGPHGVPLLDGVLAWLVCRVVARVPAGEHRVIIAEVVVGDPVGEGRPLLYHQGRFNALRD